MTWPFIQLRQRGRGEEVFAPLKAARTEALPVYVSYEYGELEEGQEFDPGQHHVVPDFR